MTKFRHILVGIIGLFFFAALSLAHAENPEASGQSPKWHSGQRIQEVFNQLNLTDDQKKQLEANKQQHRSRIESMRQEMKANKKALQEEIMKPQLDMAKVNSLHQQTKVLLGQMEDFKLSSILAVREILTPEQFSKFIALLHQHREEHD